MPVRMPRYDNADNAPLRHCGGTANCVDHRMRFLSATNKPSRQRYSTRIKMWVEIQLNVRKAMVGLT